MKASNFYPAAGLALGVGLALWYTNQKAKLQTMAKTEAFGVISDTAKSDMEIIYEIFPAFRPKPKLA